MSYSDVTLENDIRARAFSLASLLLTTAHSERYVALRDAFQKEASAARLPPDEMTWFALERVAVKLGQKPIRLKGDEADTSLPASAIVLIDPTFPAPDSPAHPVVRALRYASLVVAPAEWAPILRQARVPAFSADDLEDAAERPASTTRRPGP